MKYDRFEKYNMSLTTITEINNSQIPFGQVGNQISSSGVFRKQSVKQITDTKVSYCNFSFDNFTNIFRCEITDIIWDEFSEQIILKLEYADIFFVHLTLKGYWELDEEQKFQLMKADWNFEEKENNPASTFVLNTFIAILCLSNKVKVEIPTIDYHFVVSVPSPLNKISEILQNRQLAYRLMVIEKAFQTSLPFPGRFIAGEEVENIAFCYQAIVDREFDWICNDLTFFPVSTAEYLNLLPPTNQIFPLTFPTPDVEKFIFGRLLNLGQLFIEIIHTVVVNYEEARKNLLALTGKPVEVVVKSINGKIHYKAIDVPTLPENAFIREIQNLIDLEKKLDSVYFDKYLDSFSNAFEDLTQEQIQAVTKRPDLEAEAFNF